MAETIISPTGQKPPAGESAGLGALLANGGSTVGVIAAVAYAAGLLIINADLGYYGASRLDLVSAEYARAGFLWLFLLSFTAFFSDALFKLGRSRTSARWLEKVSWQGSGVTIAAQFIFLSLISTVVASAPISFLQMYYTEYESRAKLNPYRICWIIGVSASYTLILVPPLIRGVLVGSRQRIINPADAEEASADGQRDMQYLIRVVGGTLAVILLIAMLVTYALYVFPDLPREFGGGKKSLVELVFQEASSLPWESMGVLVSADGKRTGPVHLVLETDQMLVLAPLRPRSSQSSIWLDKKLVAAVLSFPSSLPLESWEREISRVPSVGSRGELSSATACIASWQGFEQANEANWNEAQLMALHLSDQIALLPTGTKVLVTKEYSEYSTLLLLTPKAAEVKVLSGDSAGKTCWIPPGPKLNQEARDWYTGRRCCLNSQRGYLTGVKQKTQYRVRTWREYNLALINRGSLRLGVDEEALRAWRYAGPRQRGAQSV